MVNFIIVENLNLCKVFSVGKSYFFSQIHALSGTFSITFRSFSGVMALISSRIFFLAGVLGSVAYLRTPFLSKNPKENLMERLNLVNAEAN